MRLFFAVVPDAAAVSALAETTAAVRLALAGSEPLRWTEASRQHLTIHFLGEVDAARLPAIVDAVTAVPPAELPFTVELTGIGVFPQAGPVRAVWLGVGAGLEPLVRLHAALGERLRTLGMTPDPRPFSPHLTLARVRRGRGVPGLRRRLATIPGPLPIRWPVSAVVLFESVLSGPRPRYIERARIALGEP